MSGYGVVALIGWMVPFAFFVWGFAVYYSIVTAINSKRSDEEPQHLNKWPMPLWWLNVFQVHTQYRRYYPDGTLMRRYWLIELAAWGCFALVAILSFLLVK
jgi:hypothetical protein